MSYNSKLLFDELSARLRENPRKTLRELSTDLRISERTIEEKVRLFTCITFRQFREELLLMTIRDQFADRPEITIKEVSLGLGFKSSSSFARVVRRASGLTPQQFRSRASSVRKEEKSSVLPTAN
jgi:AraC-like DNA-binding protein